MSRPILQRVARGVIPAALAGLLSAAGCGKSADARQEASLPELDRALAMWMMTHSRPPAMVDDLTNVPALQGKRLPTPPAGKKLALDDAGAHVIFTNR